MEGYNIYRQDRKKGGGGLLAYTTTALISKKISYPNKLKLLEILAVQVKVKHNDILFVGLYRPPKVSGNDYYLRLEEELNSVFMWATMTNSTVVLTGDLNLNRMEIEQRQGKILRDLEEVFDMECLIKEPTRFTSSSSTLLDVILTNRPDMFQNSGVYDPAISDHCLVYGLMKQRVHQHNSKVVTFRSFKQVNFEQFHQDLETAPWSVMNMHDTIDEKYAYWKSLFMSIVDKHLPEKKMRFREKDVPYMTEDWKRAIKEKRLYARKYAHHRTVENWELKRKWRNEATKCRRRAIKRYWVNKSADLKLKPGDFFKAFKPFIGSKNNSSKPDSNINIKLNGVVIKDQVRVANTLANYFSTMANDIGGSNATNLSESDFELHPSLSSIEKAIENQDNWSFDRVNQTQVQTLLEGLNIKKATGWDSISPRLLRTAAKGITDSLTTLYNNCIDQGKWPEEWKRGIWIPAYKKDDPTDVKNYRPITLLCTVDKIFEQLLTKQINERFENVLAPCISAYRKTYSCETTLLRLVEDWKSAVDRNDHLGIVSTDMSKAFDSMHPALMINKLKAYGFSEDALNLMRSYFRERTNKVKLGPVLSDWNEVVRGCPQGSSFGPVLWNIFQNDLTYSVKDSHLSMYADDHQLYAAEKTTTEVEKTLNKNGALVSKQWYDNNMLKGNHDKYKVLLVNRRKQDTTINVKFGKINMESSKELKLLGVTIDSKLNFTMHISEICKKASCKIGVLSRLRNLIPAEAKLQIFKAAILPNLTYCHTVWNFCKATDRRKLERIQERALRIALDNKTANYQELLTQARLPSLTNRRLQDILIIMYKVKNKLVPQQISNIFYHQEKRYNLRNSDFPVPSFQTVTYGKHSIKYMGPYLWSKLDKDLRSKPSLKSFKRAIRTKDVERFTNGDCSSCPLCSK